MSAVQLYFLLKLNTIVGVFVIASVLLAITCLALLIVWGARESDFNDTETIKKLIKRHFKWLLPLSLFFALTAAFIPSTKEMAALIVVPKICEAATSNKELMALPGDIVSLASAWIKELRPKNIKESAKTVVQQPQHKSTTVDSGK